MVEVEKRRLCPLEQEVIAGIDGIVQQTDGVNDIGRKSLAQLIEPVDDLVDIDRFAARLFARRLAALTPFLGMCDKKVANGNRPLCGDGYESNNPYD